MPLHQPVIVVYSHLFESQISWTLLNHLPQANNKNTTSMRRINAPQRTEWLNPLGIKPTFPPLQFSSITPEPNQ